MNQIKKIIAKYRSYVWICFAIFFFLLIINGYIGQSKALREEKIVVVIDPGHGGNDPGKVSQEGVLEKDINLQIALYLKDELERMGIEVVMTRYSDVCLAVEGATNKKSSDMKNRAELINDLSPTCMVSIHQNAYTDQSVSGAQVFYCSESVESQILAENIQKKLIEEVDPDNNRKIKAGDDYYILRKTSCPGVIVECGFLSCPVEAERLSDEMYQRKIAAAIATAIFQSYKN